MTFSRDEEVLMMLYSPGSKSGLVKALRKMSADLGQHRINTKIRIIQ